MPTEGNRTARQQHLARVGQAELSRLLDVSARTLVNWRGEGCPYEREGREVVYVVPRVVAWMLERERRRAETTPEAGETIATESAEKLRKLRAEADQAEMRAARMRGELGPIALMDAAVERMAVLVRTEVRGLRARYARDLVGLATVPDAAAVLDTMAEQILRALARGAQSVRDATDDDGADTSPDA